MLQRTFAALRPGGRLVFETRDPGRRAWERWTRAESWRRVQIDGVGSVETWAELTGVNLPLVSFRHTWVFESDGAVLTSDSTLRFRNRVEIESDLQRHGYAVDEVRDWPMGSPRGPTGRGWSSCSSRFEPTDGRAPSDWPMGSPRGRLENGAPLEIAHP